MWALDTEKVPLLSVTHLLAVNAHDINDALKLFWHGVFRNLSPSSLPSSCHTLLADNRFLAEWASIIKTCKFSKAMRVNRMTTGEILGRLPAAEHVFIANTAIVLVLVWDALVRVEDTNTDAHAAPVAMAKRLHSSNAAKPALLAVERLLRHRHPQIAIAAVVLSKHRLAVDTLIPETLSSR